jgi:Cu2+-exporting ATPase
MEEPGSGAVATIENKVVSIGTLDWIQRYFTCWLLCIKYHSAVS